MTYAELRMGIKLRSRMRIQHNCEEFTRWVSYHNNSSLCLIVLQLHDNAVRLVQHLIQLTSQKFCSKFSRVHAQIFGLFCILADLKTSSSQTFRYSMTFKYLNIQKGLKQDLQIDMSHDLLSKSGSRRSEHLFDVICSVVILVFWRTICLTTR